jgi:hypothetical protein
VDAGQHWHANLHLLTLRGDENVICLPQRSSSR